MLGTPPQLEMPINILIDVLTEPNAAITHGTPVNPIA